MPLRSQSFFTCDNYTRKKINGDNDEYEKTLSNDEVKQKTRHYKPYQCFKAGDKKPVVLTDSDASTISINIADPNCITVTLHKSNQSLSNDSDKDRQNFKRYTSKSSEEEKNIDQNYDFLLLKVPALDSANTSLNTSIKTKLQRSFKKLLSPLKTELAYERSKGSRKKEEKTDDKPERCSWDKIKIPSDITDKYKNEKDPEKYKKKDLKSGGKVMHKSRARTAKARDKYCTSPSKIPRYGSKSRSPDINLYLFNISEPDLPRSRAGYNSTDQFLHIKENMKQKKRNKSKIPVLATTKTKYRLYSSTNTSKSSPYRTRSKLAKNYTNSTSTSTSPERITEDNKTSLIFSEPAQNYHGNSLVRMSSGCDKEEIENILSQHSSNHKSLQERKKRKEENRQKRAEQRDSLRRSCHLKLTDSPKETVKENSQTDPTEIKTQENPKKRETKYFDLRTKQKTPILKLDDSKKIISCKPSKLKNLDIEQTKKTKRQSSETSDLRKKTLQTDYDVAAAVAFNLRRTLPVGSPPSRKGLQKRQTNRKSRDVLCRDNRPCKEPRPCKEAHPCQQPPCPTRIPLPARPCKPVENRGILPFDQCKAKNQPCMKDPCDMSCRGRKTYYQNISKRRRSIEFLKEPCEPLELDYSWATDKCSVPCPCPDTIVTVPCPPKKVKPLPCDVGIVPIGMPFFDMSEGYQICRDKEDLYRSPGCGVKSERSKAGFCEDVCDQPTKGKERPEVHEYAYLKTCAVPTSEEICRSIRESRNTKSNKDEIEEEKHSSERDRKSRVTPDKASSNVKFSDKIKIKKGEIPSKNSDDSKYLEEEQIKDRVSMTSSEYRIISKYKVSIEDDKDNRYNTYAGSKRRERKYPEEKTRYSKTSVNENRYRSYSKTDDAAEKRNRNYSNTSINKNIRNRDYPKAGDDTDRRYRNNSNTSLNKYNRNNSNTSLNKYNRNNSNTSLNEYNRNRGNSKNDDNMDRRYRNYSKTSVNEDRGYSRTDNNSDRRYRNYSRTSVNENNRNRNYSRIDNSDKRNRNYSKSDGQRYTNLKIDGKNYNDSKVDNTNKRNREYSKTRYQDYSKSEDRENKRYKDYYENDDKDSPTPSSKYETPPEKSRKSSQIRSGFRGRPQACIREYFQRKKIALSKESIKTASEDSDRSSAGSDRSSAASNRTPENYPDDDRTPENYPDDDYKDYQKNPSDDYEKASPDPSRSSKEDRILLGTCRGNRSSDTCSRRNKLICQRRNKPSCTRITRDCNWRPPDYKHESVENKDTKKRDDQDEDDEENTKYEKGPIVKRTSNVSLSGGQDNLLNPPMRSRSGQQNRSRRSSPRGSRGSCRAPPCRSYSRESFDETPESGASDPSCKISYPGHRRRTQPEWEIVSCRTPSLTPSCRDTPPNILNPMSKKYICEVDSLFSVQSVSYTSVCPGGKGKRTCRPPRKNVVCDKVCIRRGKQLQKHADKERKRYEKLKKSSVRPCAIPEPCITKNVNSLGEIVPCDLVCQQYPDYSREDTYPCTQVSHKKKVPVCRRRNSVEFSGVVSEEDCDAIPSCVRLSRSSSRRSSPCDERSLYSVYKRPSKNDECPGPRERKVCQPPRKNITCEIECVRRAKRLQKQEMRERRRYEKLKKGSTRPCDIPQPCVATESPYSLDPCKITPPCADPCRRSPCPEEPCEVVRPCAQSGRKKKYSCSQSNRRKKLPSCLLDSSRKTSPSTPVLYHRPPARRDSSRIISPCPPSPCSNTPSCVIQPCRKPPPCYPNPCIPKTSCAPEPCPVTSFNPPDPCRRTPPCPPEFCRRPPPCYPEPCTPKTSCAPEPCPATSTVLQDTSRRTPPCTTESCTKPPPCYPEPCLPKTSCAPEPCPSTLPEPGRRRTHFSPRRRSPVEICQRPSCSVRPPCEEVSSYSICRPKSKRNVCPGPSREIKICKPPPKNIVCEIECVRKAKRLARLEDRQYQKYMKTKKGSARPCAVPQPCNVIRNAENSEMLPPCAAPLPCRKVIEKLPRPCAVARKPPRERVIQVIICDKCGRKLKYCLCNKPRPKCIPVNTCNIGPDRDIFRGGYDEFLEPTCERKTISCGVIRATESPISICSSSSHTSVSRSRRPCGGPQRRCHSVPPCAISPKPSILSYRREECGASACIQRKIHDIACYSPDMYRAVFGPKIDETLMTGIEKMRQLFGFFCGENSIQSMNSDPVQGVPIGFSKTKLEKPECKETPLGSCKSCPSQNPLNLTRSLAESFASCINRVVSSTGICVKRLIRRYSEGSFGSVYSRSLRSTAGSSFGGESYCNRSKSTVPCTAPSPVCSNRSRPTVSPICSEKSRICDSRVTPTPLDGVMTPTSIGTPPDCKISSIPSCSSEAEPSCRHVSKCAFIKHSHHMCSDCQGGDQIVSKNSSETLELSATAYMEAPRKSKHVTEIGDCSKNETPCEVRFAITKILIYDDFTTYEIYKSTKSKPKVLPTKTEGVFVLKNKHDTSKDVLHK